MTVAARPDLEQAGELKFGQVGIANLRVRTLDIGRLIAEMAERVQRAPGLFARAAVVVDFGSLPASPDAASARRLLEGLHQAGVRPVALAFGTSDNDALAQALDLPLLAKFRAQYDPSAPVPAPTPPPTTPAAEPIDASPVVAPAPAAAPATAVGKVHLLPVRSGQQLYAEGADLTVCAGVGAGAEVLADGSIHIYGALRGRALAGAQGNEQARVFCREFHAELIAIAGQYRVLEDVPASLHGRAVQAWLEDGALHIAAM